LGKTVFAVPRTNATRGFDGSSFSARLNRLNSLLHNARCRRSGVVYGDQSMFVRKSLFDHIGGFPELELEDLIFSDQAVEAAGRSYLLPLNVLTDSQAPAISRCWPITIHLRRIAAFLPM
jgi:hypothetical protein